MAHALPTDLTDWQQSFHALFDFDERAEVFDFADAPGHRRAHRIFILRADPRVGHHLLEAQAQLSGFFVDADDLHIDGVADLHEFAGLDAAAVRDLAHV